jgi:micrococcal nuclease
MPQKRLPVKVIKVADGDTLTVELLQQTQEQKDSNFFNPKEKVRLIGIDAPEKKQGVWGIKAKDFLTTKVLGKIVELEADVTPRDQYGRMLAYVYLRPNDEGTELINESLVRNGMAVVYTVPPNVSKVDQLLQAQEMAKKNKAGIWSGDSPLKEIPSDYRRKERRKK